jgi:hypothetical protein
MSRKRLTILKINSKTKRKFWLVDPCCFWKTLVHSGVSNAFQRFQNGFFEVVFLTMYALFAFLVVYFVGLSAFKTPHLFFFLHDHTPDLA